MPAILFGSFCVKISIRRFHESPKILHLSRSVNQSVGKSVSDQKLNKSVGGSTSLELAKASVNESVMSWWVSQSKDMYHSKNLHGIANVNTTEIIWENSATPTRYRIAASSGHRTQALYLIHEAGYLHQQGIAFIEQDLYTNFASYTRGRISASTGHRIHSTGSVYKLCILYTRQDICINRASHTQHMICTHTLYLIHEAGYLHQ